MINLNELSVLILTVGGYNVWGSCRGFSPLKYHNEEDKERGPAALLPPLMTRHRCTPHVSYPPSFVESRSCTRNRQTSQ